MCLKFLQDSVDHGVAESFKVDDQSVVLSTLGNMFGLGDDNAIEAKAQELKVLFEEKFQVE